MDNSSKAENPRWILLTGIFFASLFVLWLFKLAIAVLFGKLGYESISKNEIFNMANVDACRLIILGSELVRADPLLKLTSGISEIDSISKLSRAAAGLASTSCKLYDNIYRFRVSTQEHSVELRRDAELDLNKSIDEFLVESNRASDFLRAAPENFSNINGLEEAASLIRLASAYVVENEQTLRKAIRLGSHFVSTTQDEYWLVGLQNLSEARATGGILGNYALVKVGASGFELIESGSNLDLFAKGESLVVKEYRSSYQVLGANPFDWRDINAIPEERVALQSLLVSWEKNSDWKLDGVILLGQGLAAQAIALSGPILVDGITLDGSNAKDFLAGGIYEKFPDQDQRNRVLSTFLELVFASLATQNFNIAAVLENSESIRSADRLLVMAKEQDLDVFLNSQAEQDDRSGVIHIALNNAGANKLDRYTFIEAANCTPSANSKFAPTTQEHVIEIRNTSPRVGLPEHVSPRYFRPSGDLIEMGTNRLQLLVGVPAGLSLIDFETSTAQEVFTIIELGDRTFYVFEFEIAAGLAENFRFIHSNTEDLNAGFKFSPMLNQPEINQQLCTSDKSY